MMLTTSIKNHKVMLGILSVLLCIGIVTGWYYYSEMNYSARTQLSKDQEALEKQSGDMPDDVDTHLSLGWTYYQQNKKQDAQKEFNKVLKLDKINVNAIYGLGLIDKDLGVYGSAEKKMNQILQINPMHQQAIHSLAQIYWEEKKYDLAERQYLKALDVSPGSADIIVELGQVYEAQGKKAEAVKQYSDALRYVPGLETAVKGLGRLK